MLASLASPALAGTVEQFTGGGGEVDVELPQGGADNTTTVSFPAASRVRDASVTLKPDQSVVYGKVSPDGGNVSAWSASVDDLDPANLDLEGLMGVAFTEDELTRVTLNATDSKRTTVSQNVSAHLFAFDLLTALGGASTDLGLTLDWTGVGVRQGTTAVDEAHLYVADHLAGMWREWASFSRVPSTGAHVHKVSTVGPGWTNASGHLHLLAVAEPLSPGQGTSLSTSHVALEFRQVLAGDGVAVDVGDDGAPEFAWNGTGAGLFGLQNALEDGSGHAVVDFATQRTHSNFSSFLLPEGADVVSASVGLLGSPGEVVTERGDTPGFVDGGGVSTGTEVTGVPDYAHPRWAQVVLKELKNAGMKDQSQEVITTGQILGDYSSGTRSIAQTFKPSISGDLIFINLSLEGAEYAIAPDITVEIRTTNATGHPTSTVLGTGTIDGSEVNVSSPKWYTVSFTDTALTVGTLYAIVVSVPMAQSGETYEWKNHLSGGDTPYRYGKSFFDDSIDGSGPWTEVPNTDQAFITYMETDITTGLADIRVAGSTYDYVRSGPSGDEYVYNVSDPVVGPSGDWGFTVTNDNAFPISFNWTGSVHSAVYPQEAGLALSTEVANASFYTLGGTLTDLDEPLWLAFGAELATLLDGAPVAYTAPNGVAFVRVNVTASGNVTGSLIVTGLRVRYYLPVEVAGPPVVAAAEAYRAANAGTTPVKLPVTVSSASSARVLLSDPSLTYDLRPTFTTATQVLEEDTYKLVDLDTMFGDDFDNNNLTHAIMDVDDPDNVTLELDGSELNITPAPDFFGEIVVTVSGADSTGQSVVGTFRIVVQGENDPPVLDLRDSYSAKARVTLTLDLSGNVSDVDDPPSALELDTNSSFISKAGLTLYATFDDEGEYRVNVTLTDGQHVVHKVVTFRVSAAEGYPSIVGMPAELRVPINRQLPLDMAQFGSDGEDSPEELTWEVTEESQYFNVSYEASTMMLTVSPTGVGQGTGIALFVLTDTDGNAISKRVTVNVTERQLEAPRIDLETLPDLLKLDEDGDAYVLDLADYVEDDTPIADLHVSARYSEEDVVTVVAQEGSLSFVPLSAGKVTVTVTLTDSDELSSEFELDVEVAGEDDGEEMNWGLWMGLLVLIAFIIALVAWPRRAPGPGPEALAEEPPAPPAGRVSRVKPHTFRSSSLRQLEELLLFHSSGDLLSQYTREIREGVDADLERGVINAVQEMLRGRPRTREEPVDLIELEGMRVVVERGHDVAVAAVLSGEEPEGLRVQLRKALHEVQSRNEEALRDWDGDLSRLRGVDNAMVNLVESTIKRLSGSPDLAVDGDAVAGPVAEARRVKEVEGVPPLEDEEEPLSIIKDIIGEQKARELEEGKPRDVQEPEEGKD